MALGRTDTFTCLNYVSSHAARNRTESDYENVHVIPENGGLEMNKKLYAYEY